MKSGKQLRAPHKMAHLPWAQGVAGSNPVAPTKFPNVFARSENRPSRIERRLTIG